MALAYGQIKCGFTQARQPLTSQSGVASWGVFQDQLVSTMNGGLVNPDLNQLFLNMLCEE